MSAAGSAAHTIPSAIDLTTQRLGHHAEQAAGAAVVAPIAATPCTCAEQRQDGPDGQQFRLEPIDLRKAQCIRHAKSPLRRPLMGHNDTDGPQRHTTR